jgi:apolipoprotein D and lipocalin family protein
MSPPKPVSALLAVLVVLSACGASPPSGIEPVKNFDVNRYLGTWYEIARFDHRFERGLEHVTAEYSLRSDGKIKVVNTGYDVNKGRWNSATGTAKFDGDKTVGSLAVTFFWPFYGGYYIVELDKDYQYALVVGPSKKYLWILARHPTLDASVYNALVEKARGLGYPVDALIKVDHTLPVPAKPSRD